MHFLTIAIVLLMGLFFMQSVPHQKKNASLPSHHTKGGFRNTNPAYAPPNWWALHSFILAKIWQTTFAPRTFNLPVQEPDDSIVLSLSPTSSVTWVGHSTLLVQLDGVNFLTDPQWSDRASPVSFAGPQRISSPGIHLEHLPPIHLVIISHNHYDHLDLKTVKFLAAAHDPVFLVPLGLKEWFQAHNRNWIGGRIFGFNL